MPSTTLQTSVGNKPIRNVPPRAMPRWQRRLLWGSFVPLAVSGLLWLGLHAAGNDANGMPLYAAAKLWAMRVHAAAALLAVLSAGSLLASHVPQGWRLARNRLTGVVNLLVLGCLAFTGYLLGYASEGWLRQGAVWCHWVLGIGAPIVLVAHVWRFVGERPGAHPPITPR